jgi:F-box domain
MSTPMSRPMSLLTSQAKTLRLPDAILETILSRLPALSVTSALLFSNTCRQRTNPWVLR